MRALIFSKASLGVILAKALAWVFNTLFSKSAEHEFFMTDYSLHSIGLLLFRKKQHEAFQAFVEDVLLTGGIGLLSLYSDEMEAVVSASKKFGLDFDDAYQYAVAVRDDAVLVSFD